MFSSVGSPLTGLRLGAIAPTCLRAANGVIGQFVAVDHRKDRGQVQVQHRHGRAQQPVDDRLLQTVLREDMGCLESQIAAVTVQLELAELQATVGPYERLRDRRPSACGNS